MLFKDISDIIASLLSGEKPETRDFTPEGSDLGSCRKGSWDFAVFAAHDLDLGLNTLMVRIGLCCWWIIRKDYCLRIISNLD